jgi:hypothetical protein
VAVGYAGTILTSPQDPVSIFPRLRNQSIPLLRLTSSHLFITPSFSSNPQNIRAAIYTIAGGKIAETKAETGREMKIPIEHLAHGRYVFELIGNGINIAGPFEIAR